MRARVLSSYESRCYHNQDHRRTNTPPCSMPDNRFGDTGAMGLAKALVHLKQLQRLHLASERGSGGV